MAAATYPTRITIVKPGRRTGPPAPGEIVLAIERRGVFAPNHPTTHLCLELLAGVSRSGLLRGSWLDVGSGSGALALACARLGAERVVALGIIKQ